MYILIVAIHAVLITISYFLWYSLLGWVFILLCFFFLFYFSPLFFFDTDSEEDLGNHHSAWSQIKNIALSISLKDSLFIPLIFLYLGLYLLTFSILGTEENILFIHQIIVFLLYTLFIGYAFVFSWKQDIFFDIVRFHTFFTLSSTLCLVVFCLFLWVSSEFGHFLLLLFGLSSWLFILFFHPREHSIFILLLLFSFFCIPLIWSTLLIPDTSLWVLSGVSLFAGLILFEYISHLRLFLHYIRIIQYFSLSIILLSELSIVYTLFHGVYTSGIIFSIISIVFFLFVHVRYTNYIAYIFSLVLTFFLYSIIFTGLLDSKTLTSLFLFIFFLPILLIWSTYIWEEAHGYDFMILHYTSILFSVIYSIYILFFIWWGSDILFITSLCIFGIALLLFLSYFRFRLEKTSP